MIEKWNSLKVNKVEEISRQGCGKKHEDCNNSRHKA